MSIAIDNSGSIINFQMDPVEQTGGFMGTINGWIQQAPTVIQQAVDTIPKVYQAVGAIQGAVKAGPAAQQQAKEAVYNKNTTGILAPDWLLYGGLAVAAFLILRKKG